MSFNTEQFKITNKIYMVLVEFLKVDTEVRNCI